VNGSLRAVFNLGRAYRRSVESGSSSPLDCIWTLYCRNLDKTAKLRGPYGFLAKMNRCVISWEHKAYVFTILSYYEPLPP